jgi:guanosine-3',5'-bis(diphosphate) 3'-pyrophosphohydrolase
MINTVGEPEREERGVMRGSVAKPDAHTLRHMKNRYSWQEAASLAGRAHRHQIRKDKQTPYVTHPMRVALTIACVFGFTEDEILAAALLHDTIEDTDTDYDDIHRQFGKNVADYVAAMTKDMRMIEAQREVAYDKQLAAGPWQGRLIKLADVYDNLTDCIDAKARDKQIEKAKRALALTKNDPQLAKARQAVAELVAMAESGVEHGEAFG